jgi:hypothetical protein
MLPAMAHLDVSCASCAHVSSDLLGHCLRDLLAAAAGIASIAKAIGAAAVKAVVTMVGITIAGRTLLRPLYKRVAGELSFLCDIC